jgi:glutamyl/glutaminyl-tRNA synthetase
MGWNDGTEQEIFSARELVSKFSLDRVQKSGAKFDEQRLAWMNGAHIRELTVEELSKRVKDFWPESAGKWDDGYKTEVLSLVQERLKYFAELPALTEFFFTDLPVNPELWTTHKQLKKLEPGEIKSLLEQAKAGIEQSDFSVTDLTDRLNALLELTGQKPAVLFSIIRIATTQAQSSPGLADTLATLGKNTSLRRIDAMLQEL